MLKKFILKLALYLAPFLLLLGFPSLLMVLGKETVPIEKVIRMQADKSRTTLLGRAYTGTDLYYKMNSVIRYKPRIITFGSSRVLKFRSRLFIDHEHFFNVGRIASKIHHLRPFINRIPDDAKPSIMIMSVDQWWFSNNSSDETMEGEGEAQLDYAPSTIEILSNWKKIYRDFSSGKLRIKPLIDPKEQRDMNRIGINAIIAHNGFRNDGSYLDGGFERDPSNPHNRFTKDFGFKLTHKAIAAGKGLFSYDSVISKKALGELDQVLALLKKKNIYVVGFFPPFAHEVYLDFEKHRKNYGYFFGLDSAIRPIFQKYGYNLFDYTDLAVLGATDLEMEGDAYHTTEKSTLRMMIDMAQKDPVLGKEVNLEDLKKRLMETKGNLSVFGEEY